MAENNGNNGSNQLKSMTMDGVWYAVIRPFLHDYGADFFGNMVGQRSQKAGEFVSLAMKLGVNASEPVKSLWQAAKKSRDESKGMLEDFAPALAAEFGKSNPAKLMASKNQIIAHERTQLMGRVKYEIYSAASGLLVMTDDVLDRVDKKRHSMAEAQKAAERAAERAEQARDGKAGDAKRDTRKDTRTRNPKSAKGGMAGKGLDAVASSQQFERFASSSIFDEQNRPMLKMGIGVGIPLLKGYIDNQGGKKHGKSSAHDLIKAVVKQARSGDGHIDYVMHPKSKGQVPLKDYVLDVFKQHQSDMNEAPLNDRFRYMPELEEACDIIADEIKDNLLDPRALVSLVGDRVVLDAHMRVASPETVRAEIGKIRRAIEKTENINPDHYLADTAYETGQGFKEVLDAVPEEHKPFFVHLFPDAVLQEYGKMKEPEITELRTRGEQEFVERMTEAIEALGAMNEVDLQRAGLTSKEGKLMANLAAEFEKKGADVVMEDLKGKKLLDATEAVRNARGYWQNLVTERRSPVVTEAERITASAADPAGPAAPLSSDERARLEELEARYRSEQAEEPPLKGGFAEREKAHTTHGGKYADAVRRRDDAAEHHAR